jgi:UDP-glucuronate decarboxylase
MFLNLFHLLFLETIIIQDYEF